MNLVFIFVGFAFFACCLNECGCARTKDKIYVNLVGYNACFRRLNNTHQVGCGSARRGNVGILHYVRNDSDVAWLRDVGPHAPYIPLMTPKMFNASNIEDLKSKINGVLLIYTENVTTDFELPVDFSPDSKCPNQYSDFYQGNADYANCKNISWNSLGQDLFHQNHDFPMVVLTDKTEVDNMIENCYNKYNAPNGASARDYPLCAVEVKSAMDAAVDTPTCIRRTQLVTNLNPQEYCDPLGDYNVFGFMKPASESEIPDKSLIMAVTRLDSFSMFENVYPSVNNPISSIITLLAAAEALGHVKSDFRNANKSLMLALFNGEAFDYIGSERLVYDMENGDFPKYTNEDNGPAAIGLSKVLSMIEVSQVGKQATDVYNVYTHTDPVTRDNGEINSEVETMLSKLEELAQENGLSLENTLQAQPLPPASSHSFLKKQAMPTVVLADHQQNFTNLYYNSIYDLPMNIKADYPDTITEEEKYNYVTDAASNLAKLATVLAQSLYELTTGASTNITANETLVANLLYCYTYSPNCELFNYTLEPEDAAVIKKEDLKYYVSIWYIKNWATHITQHLLTYFMGDIVDISNCTTSTDHSARRKCCERSDAAKNDWFHEYEFIGGPMNSETEERTGICVKAPVFISTAKSPAFEDDYDFGTNRYSAWSESKWGRDAISVRYFLVPHLTMELKVLLVGLCVAIVSMPATYFFARRAKFLFIVPDCASVETRPVPT